jgi:glycosyltransferase involved in cell wall biosynthesis
LSEQRYTMRSVTPEIAQFISFYEKGLAIEALHALFSLPNLSYDALQNTPFDAAVLNYADALMHGNFLDLKITLLSLVNFCRESNTLEKELEWDYTQLLMEASPSLPEGWEMNKAASLFLIYELEKSSTIISPKQQDQLVEQVPFPRRNAFKKQIGLSQNIIKFHAGYKERYSRILKDFGLLFRPLYPINFGKLKLNNQKSGSIPVFFLEPYEIQWDELLSSYKGEPALFLFWDPSILQQCLQFPEVLEALLDPQHEMLILNQISPPNFSKFQQADLKPCLITKNKRIQETADEIIAVIRRLPKSSQELYCLGKELHFRIRHDRLGRSRYLPLLKRFHDMQWKDPHREGHKADYMKPPIDQLPSILNSIQPLPKRKISSSKLNLAHITAQLVDGGHSPTKILLTILERHNQKKFNLSLYVNEFLVIRPQCYPISIFFSPESAQRAPKALEILDTMGINVHLDDAQLDYEETANRLALWLKEKHIDIAIFHGANLIHLMTAKQSDVPIKVYFDHGGNPPSTVFDFYIFSEETQKKFWDPSSVVIPFPVFVETNTEKKISISAELDIPFQAQIMTTISNHLETRITDEMVAAIAAICKRCPNAYYAPIGQVFDPDKFKKRFSEAGIIDRIRLPGNVSSPMQLAQSMHLYLNEFPFGGCIGMLEAMAAGCPVVTMYYKDGPPQARYGSYFGLERSIISGNVNEYVDLAIELLQNKKKYEEWSKIAKERFKKHADISGYITTLENTIDSWVKKTRMQK